MLSRRPYLLRAIYEWLLDCEDTPFLLVNTTEPNVDVPVDFVKDDKIILNIGATAVENLNLGNDAICFSARFNGVSQAVYIPMQAVMAIYGRESGRGIMFGQDDEPVTEEPSNSSGTEDRPARGKPKLEIIK